MWIVAVLVGMGIAGFIVWGISSPDPSQGSGSADRIVEGAQITYYFGAECSHCLEVKKVIEEKHLRDLVVFSEKEVWHNTRNAAEMEDRATECGLNLDEIGVPFLFSRGECFIGSPDVIQELESQTEFEESA